jgi:hypothetical protein
VRLPGVSLGREGHDTLGQGARGQVGERHPLEHGTHVGAQRHPQFGEAGSGTLVVQALGSGPLDRGSGPLHGAEHIGDGDLGRRAVQRVPTVGPAARTHQIRVTEVGEDIPEELLRDPWARLSCSPFTGSPSDSAAASSVATRTA